MVVKRSEVAGELDGEGRTVDEKGVDDEVVHHPPTEHREPADRLDDDGAVDFVDPVLVEQEFVDEGQPFGEPLRRP